MSEQPHSSQTAPIDEYRVLWTTQKKQKLKKWHDGFLRFHRFNKRMLVYDDARHLVADMYLRGRDAIGEGDDLEFEHHLVTIEDFKGTVVQDLTPLFSPAVQRKQKLQAGNALLDFPTPNQANRHGPWGPSRHVSPTPQPFQQRCPVAVARPPQTPVQRKPTNTSNTSLQQSIRANNNINHPSPYQSRSSRPGQSLNILTGMEPPKRLDIISKPNLPVPQGQNSLQWQEKLQNSIKERQSGPKSVPAVYTSKGPSFSVPGGLLSPTRRSNQPLPLPHLPPVPLQRIQQYSPRQNSVPSNLTPRANQGSIAAFDLDSFSDSIRLPPGTESPLLHSRPTSLFSHPAPPRINKDTPEVAIDIYSDEGLYESVHDFHILTSPQPPRRSGTPEDSKSARAQKRSPSVLSIGNDSRTFRPPSKRKTTILPENPSNPHGFRPPSQQKATALPTKPLKTHDCNGSGSGENSEKEPLGPLIGAGTLFLGNTAKRKRNKLLCQLPPDFYASASKEPPVPTTGQKFAKNSAKRPKTDFVSNSTALGIIEKTMVIKDDSGIPPTMSPPATKRVAIQNRDSDKGKSSSNILNSVQEHRIEEAEDTLEYQLENDIGPWSSEAFDLFDWRPPNIAGRK